MCECVDRNALHAEFCVMKIVPIFFCFFVGSRKVCWQSASRWHQRCAPWNSSVNGDVFRQVVPRGTPKSLHNDSS